MTGRVVRGWLPILLLALGGCGGQRPVASPAKAVLELRVASSAFAAGAAIPERYTCDGEDLSPPLSWSDPPAGTQSLALICDDPDAPGGTWDHWLAYDLPATLRSLPEGVLPLPEMAGGGAQGLNSWRRTGYGGPCPPKGTEHRYFFRVYALDTVLGLKPGATRHDLERAMAGHILAEGNLMGRYGR